MIRPPLFVSYGLVLARETENKTTGNKVHLGYIWDSRL